MRALGVHFIHSERTDVPLSTQACQATSGSSVATTSVSLPGPSFPRRTKFRLQLHPLSPCNRSLQKSQSKPTHRQHLRALVHHTQLWEKVPGQPVFTTGQRKRAATEALCGSSRVNLHPLLPPTRRSHSRSDASLLGSCRVCGPVTFRWLPRQRRRGYESAPRARRVSAAVLRKRGRR